MAYPKICEKIQRFPHDASQWTQDLEPTLQKLARIEPYSVIHNPENWPIRHQLEHFFRDIMRCRADYFTTLEHFSDARTAILKNLENHPLVPVTETDGERLQYTYGDVIDDDLDRLVKPDLFMARHSFWKTLIQRSPSSFIVLFPGTLGTAITLMWFWGARPRTIIYGCLSGFVFGSLLYLSGEALSYRKANKEYG